MQEYNVSVADDSGDVQEVFTVTAEQLGNVEVLTGWTAYVEGPFTPEAYNFALDCDDVPNFTIGDDGGRIEFEIEG